MTALPTALPATDRHLGARTPYIPLRDDPSILVAASHHCRAPVGLTVDPTVGLCISRRIPGPQGWVLESRGKGVSHETTRGNCHMCIVYVLGVVRACYV